jgi:hypothetical protein
MLYSETSKPSGPRRRTRPFRREPDRSLSVPVALGLLVALHADDKLGVVERKVVDPQVEAAAVRVRPQSADRLPELRLAGLGDRVEPVRRARLGGFGRHGTVLSIVSPPQWRPRCPFKGRGGKAGLSQADRRSPGGRGAAQAQRGSERLLLTRAPRQNRAQREDALVVG